MRSGRVRQVDKRLLVVAMCLLVAGLALNLGALRSGVLANGTPGERLRWMGPAAVAYLTAAGIFFSQVA
jgi:hypothetical protein